ncbi:hypothetical protein TNIN_285601 [Trichonephila inaurata madagascariensis]|uniref:Uncharacterized protein n=1 Tax=Trichonephila inaurata madagascariensis TaxID=2747483 RepID=A0A8X7CAA7_9ARAC|nr:hypothetical protein TNIN_285601 [Trichonephila inaurata madagascariensis]
MKSKIIKFHNSLKKSSCLGWKVQLILREFVNAIFGANFSVTVALMPADFPLYKVILYVHAVWYRNIHQGVYMINSCPVNYEDEEVRRMQNDNFSDPLLSIPVTDISTASPT